MRRLMLLLSVLAAVFGLSAEDIPFWGGAGESATNRTISASSFSVACATSFDSRTAATVVSDRVHPPRGVVLILR